MKYLVMKVFICVLVFFAVTALARPDGENNGYRYEQPELAEPDEEIENEVRPESDEDKGQTVRIIKEEVQPPKIRTLKIIHERAPEIKTIQILQHLPPPPPIVKQIKVVRKSPPPPPEVKTISVLHQPPPPPPEVKQIRLVHHPQPHPQILKTVKLFQPIHHHVKYIAPPAPIPIIRHIAAPLPASLPAPLPVPAPMQLIHQPIGAASAVHQVGAAPLPVLPASMYSSSLGAHSYGPTVIGSPMSGIEAGSYPVYAPAYGSGTPSHQVLESAPAYGTPAVPAPAPLAPVAAAPEPLISGLHFGGGHGGYSLPIPSNHIHESPTIAGEEFKFLRLVKK